MKLSLNHLDICIKDDLRARIALNKAKALLTIVSSVKLLRNHTDSAFYIVRISMYAYGHFQYHSTFSNTLLSYC